MGIIVSEIPGNCVSPGVWCSKLVLIWPHTCTCVTQGGRSTQYCVIIPYIYYTMAMYSHLYVIIMYELPLHCGVVLSYSTML